MITWLLGQPRSGKSYYAASTIAETLGTTDLRVVTNLPLKLGALAEYVDRKWPAANAGRDVLWRVQVLERGQLDTWFRFRGNKPLEWTETPDGRLCSRWEAVTADWGRDAEHKPSEMHPVLYVLDEVQNIHKVSEWNEARERGIAPERLMYLSQHGHMGDEVVLITHDMGLVAKQLRVYGNKYVVVKNLAQVNRWGFKMPKVFIRKVFDTPPYKQGASLCYTVTERLDPKEIGSIYETASGVGLVGGGNADSTAKRQGLAWPYVIGGCCLLLAGLVAAPWVVRKVSGAAIGAAFPAKRVSSGVVQTQAVSMVSVQPVTVAAAAGAAASGTNSLRARPAKSEVEDEEEKDWLKYVSTGGEPVVYTGLGKTYFTEDIAEITRQRVKLRNGLVLHWVEPSKPQADGPASHTRKPLKLTR